MTLWLYLIDLRETVVELGFLNISWFFLGRIFHCIIHSAQLQQPLESDPPCAAACIGGQATVLTN